MRVAHRSATRPRHSLALVTGIGVTALVLSACGKAAPADDDGQLTVVASTPVWAAVAEEISGGAARVEPVIASSAADPHSYESSPRDAAKINDADLVVYNGGGYDSFVEQILASTGEKPTVQAVEAASHGPGQEEHGQGEHGHGDGADAGHSHGDAADSHAHGEHADHGNHDHGSSSHDHGHGHGGHNHANEHIWYDPPAVQQTANRIAEELAALQPDKAEHFREGAHRFNGELDQLERRIDQLRERHRGERIVVTEPVAHYLIERAGLDDITPPSFTQAIEGERDPSAASLADIRRAVRSGEAKAVVYNPQTESRVTEGIREIAESQGVPVVEMTESPTSTSAESGEHTYQRWMTSQVDSLTEALDKS